MWTYNYREDIGRKSLSRQVWFSQAGYLKIQWDLNASLVLVKVARESLPYILYFSYSGILHCLYYSKVDLGDWYSDLTLVCLRLSSQAFFESQRLLSLPNYLSNLFCPVVGEKKPEMRVGLESCFLYCRFHYICPKAWIFVSYLTNLKAYICFDQRSLAEERLNQKWESYLLLIDLEVILALANILVWAWLCEKPCLSKLFIAITRGLHQCNLLNFVLILL